jgi:DNA polymerase IIIc chi subunit
MAPRVQLHDLPGEKRAGELVRLVESLYKKRSRLVIWVEDEGRLQMLDEFLWTYDKLAFVPHAVGTRALGDMDEPVVLVAEPVNPNGAEVLVVGDGLPPADWAAGFDEVHDLVPADAAGEDRRTWWAKWREQHGSGGGG